MMWRLGLRGFQHLWRFCFCGASWLDGNQLRRLKVRWLALDSEPVHTIDRVQLRSMNHTTTKVMFFD